MAVALLSWNTCSGGSHPPCHEASGAALQTELLGEKLRPPANSQRPCEGAILEEPPLIPVKPSDDCSPGRHLEYDLLRLQARTIQLRSS